LFGNAGRFVLVPTDHHKQGKGEFRVFKLHRILLAGAVLALATGSSMAATLGAGGASGSANPVPVIPPGNLLGTTTALNPTFSIDGGAAGSLAGYTGVANVNVNLGTLASFSFTTTDGMLSFGNVTSYTQDFNSYPPAGVFRSLVVSFIGEVTFNGVSGTGLLSLIFTQSGDAPIGGGLSLSVVSVPEPSSIALAGLGLASAGLFGLRKRLAK
jgi:hypothetical protein